MHCKASEHIQEGRRTCTQKCVENEVFAAAGVFFLILFVLCTASVLCIVWVAVFWTVPKSKSFDLTVTSDQCVGILAVPFATCVHSMQHVSLGCSRHQAVPAFSLFSLWCCFVPWRLMHLPAWLLFSCFFPVAVQPIGHGVGRLVVFFCSTLKERDWKWEANIPSLM